MRKIIVRCLIAVVLSSTSILAVAAESKVVKPMQTAAVVEQVKVDINSAGIEMLVRELSGVGTAKARAIVEYREANGPFASVDELLEVKGIGVSILEKNRNKLSIK